MLRIPIDPFDRLNELIIFTFTNFFSLEHVIVNEKRFQQFFMGNFTSIAFFYLFEGMLKE